MADDCPSAPRFPFDEKFLLEIGGGMVFKQARELLRSGSISAASFDAPLLKARVCGKGRPFLTGLKFVSAREVVSICACPDARDRGIICAHAVAAALSLLAPKSDESAHPDIRKPRGIPAESDDVSPTAEIPAVRFAFEGSARALDARVEFVYGVPGIRNAAFEGAVRAEILSAGFVPVGEGFVLRGEAAVALFFAGPMNRWGSRWHMLPGPRFLQVTSGWLTLRPSVSLLENSGWLDFRMHFTAGDSAMFDAEEVRRALRGGLPSLRMKNGRVALVDTHALADFEEVLRDCDPRREGNAWRVRPEFGEFLRASAEEWGAVVPSGGQPESPFRLGSLSGILRPYQLEGVRWLRRAATAGGGAMLADDMGLGKTVQALAVLQSLPGPHLVVCPSSLVWNWEAETRRFLPEACPLVLAGAERDRLLDGIPGCDIAITSYALLQRDIARLRQFSFGCVLLDEAQHIKNPDSQNARSARSLRARARIVLTGTPVENSLRDIWSLFDFLLPGYLGGREDFRERYEKPLASASASPDVWRRFRRRIAPFVLRRTKGEVLPELPDKIEQSVVVELAPVEKAAYDRLQAEARLRIDELRATGNPGAARMRVLTALLRLRQVCCDARLANLHVPEMPEAPPSAKLAALIELLQEAVDGGHRVLVFSQFVKLLDLCEPLLVRASLTFCRLDGSTKHRSQVVGEFQKPDGPPVFLISLKAGGAGLNLTAADTVVHLDPWWNPAAVAQASDRAHRIGQTRAVTIVKLIAKDTIEERVLAMQEEKRALLAGAVGALEAGGGGSPPADFPFSPDELARLVADS